MKWRIRRVEDLPSRVESRPRARNNCISVAVSEASQLGRSTRAHFNVWDHGHAHRESFLTRLSKGSDPSMSGKTGAVRLRRIMCWGVGCVRGCGLSLCVSVDVRISANIGLRLLSRAARITAAVGATRCRDRVLGRREPDACGLSGQTFPRM